MALELPLLRLGLAGFTTEQHDQLGQAVAAASPSMGWELGGFSEADAWWINGARIQLLADRTVRVASGVPGGRSIQLNLLEIDRPLAFALPVAPRNFEPVFSFHPTSSASIEQVLGRMEAWLRPMVAQFCLASQILEQESALGAGPYHVSANGKLLAVVDLRGDVGVLPTAEPDEFEEAMWSHRPGAAGRVPEAFVRCSLSQLMWQYAVRTTRDLLPRRYRTGKLYFRRPPRLPQRMLKDNHLLLLRELAGEPASFAELEQRTGLAGDALAPSLAALYLVGSVTSNAKRAGPLARRPDGPDSSHGIQHSLAPDADLDTGTPAPPRRPRFADLTAPAPMGLD